MELGLKGRKAIVTGASRGIGRAIAAQLADEGVDLVLCARGEEALDKTAAELAHFGVNVHTARLDVSETDAIVPFVERAADLLGGLDILVSNASVGTQKGPEQWQTSFQADLLAFVRLAEAAVPYLERSDAPAIVSIGTTSAFDTLPPTGPNSYGAAKAAVTHHAAALARTLAPQGIRVNTISPGPVEFPGGTWERIKEQRTEFYEGVRSRIPLGRLGTPEDVARAVAFVASPAAAYCTGVNLVVDGGFVSRVQF
ncbi:3-ketoacyl-ACP reductase [Prauserella sp. PE36]|uniref:SDR family oxidoreductase n=1 Tax=Prauserella endophytica TaxID=1592324 RepID=A0ABY2S562_9PSEU|nr:MULTISPECIES: SDR family oxidoreductase [Prauserella]RBM21811.1 3-ketoacyl-ACP reductase [Prauserella sp. PE36]TKG70977.1 SDR family oxidoreductase [Prauserella endophytica]